MHRSLLLRIATAVAASSILVACGTTVRHDADSTRTPAPDSDLTAEAGSTEVAGPRPRLVLADANSGRIDIVDLTTEETLDTFDLGHRTTLTTVNERYVYAVSDSGDTVHVLDPGSWTIDHGDHTHSYTKRPAELGRLDGSGPTQVITGDRKVATFFDGIAAADVTTFDTLSDGSSEPELSITTDAPHHGVVVPIDDHFLVSHAADDPAESRPSTFELRDGSGTYVKTFGTACPRMRGEAVFDTYVIAACDDGLFVARVDGVEWTSEKVPYPEGITPRTRPNEFRRQGPVVVGVAGPVTANDGVLAFDSVTRQWTHITTPAPVLDTNLSGDGTMVFTVLADGTFRIYDTVTGAETASVRVLLEPPGSTDMAQPTPRIVVSGKRAYVTDPAGARVQEIDYRDDARIARTLNAGFTVGSIGVVGE